MSRKKVLGVALSDNEERILLEICQPYGVNPQEMIRQLIREKYDDVIFRRPLGRPSSSAKAPQKIEVIPPMSDEEFCAYAGGVITNVYDNDEKRYIKYCKLPAGAWSESVAFEDENFRKELEASSKKLRMWKHD